MNIMTIINQDYKTKLGKDIKVFLKKKKKKSGNRVMKILAYDEKQKLVEYRKNIIK